VSAPPSVLAPLAEHRARLAPLGIALLLTYAYFVGEPAWNQNSRLALTRALVERRSTIIDPDHVTTGDKSFRAGHFYSDKAPGASWAAAVPYAAFLGLRRITGGEEPRVSVRPLDPQGPVPEPEQRAPGDRLVYNLTHRVALYVCGLFTGVLPTVAAAAAMFLLALRQLAGEVRPALAVACALGLATPVFPYATVFYGHALCGALLLWAFALVVLHPPATATGTANADIANADIANADIANADIANTDIANAGTANADIANADIANADIANADDTKTGTANADPTAITTIAMTRRMPLVVGTLLGGAVVTEYPAAVPAVMLVALAAVLHGRGFALRVVLGGVPWALALALYHQVAFGHPLHTGYDYVYLERFAEGMRVHYGIHAPQLDALWQLLWGSYRGLFYLSPVLLLAAWGLVVAARRPQGLPRAAIVTAAAIVAFYVLLNAGYYMWDGGASYGPRHLVPALGLLMLGGAAAWRASPRLFLALAAIGLLHMLLGATATPEAPQHGNPVWEYAWPRARGAEAAVPGRATNLGLLLGLPGLLSLLPLLAPWLWAASAAVQREPSR